jgi:hypothetical protein
MEYSLSGTIEYGSELCSALTYRMIDSYSAGKVKEAEEMSINACFLKSTLIALDFYQTTQNDDLLSFSKIHKLISTVHEFGYAQNLTITDFIGDVGSGIGLGYNGSGDSGGNGIANMGGIAQQPKTFSYVIQSDGQTSFQLPFSDESVDTDSVNVNVGDANPVMGIDFNISGSTFNWTGQYPLSIGWVMEIKYIG